MRFLDIAAHTTLPPMDGACRRAWELYVGLVETGAEGTFVGRSASQRHDGHMEPHSPPRTWHNRKALTALFALVTGRDYWQVKMIRKGPRRLVAGFKPEHYDVVLVNFLYALPLVSNFVKSQIPLIVDTHNYDPAYYGAMANASRNPGIRHLCHRAIRNAQRTLAKLPAGTVLVHVSEADAARYIKHRPDLRHVVVENGTMVKPREHHPDYAKSGKRILMFVGGLAGQINQDALKNFAYSFWPRLKDKSEFRVVGSSPPRHLRMLCDQHGWTLYPDVTESQLDDLYSEAHFAVLPFEYGEGSKLKFFEACGRGVPVMATQAGLCGISNAPHLVTNSNNPEVWRNRLESLRELNRTEVGQLIEYSESFSWGYLSKKLRQVMDEVKSQNGQTKNGITANK